MAIYHLNKSSVQRSKGQSAVASAAYISGSKLTYNIIDGETNVTISRIFDYSNKLGLAFSQILAPDNVPSWVYNREELWGKVEEVEGRINSRPAYKFITALPKELTLEQNIELAQQFATKYLVSSGMVADVNIHYDNENNPHLHIQTTSRELEQLANGEIGFGAKNRQWQTIETLRYQRAGWAEVVNAHLELHGCLGRVSHLSHKARGIELTATVHEGPARHIAKAELREINRRIILENAAKIRENPELVFDKLSINKPVFTKEEIAIVLSDALAIDLELGQAAQQVDSSVDGSSDNSSITAANSTVATDIESLNCEYSSEFMLLYHKLLGSQKISLINPSDLKDRTLYALTKRVQLEQRFVGIVAGLQHSHQHNLSIDDKAIDELSIKERLIANAVKVGSFAQEVINDKTGLKIALAPEQPAALTEEQRKSVIEIANGSDISVLTGYPGAGKTFVMREVVHQYKKAGYRVIGTAPSSTAAQVLASATGVESKNIALWRKEWQEAKGQKFELALRANYYTEEQYQVSPAQDNVVTDFSQYCNNKDVTISSELNDKTILIIDEASMIELANMDYLLTEVARRGAKAIIVGDNNQFAAVGMSGAFKKICAMSSVSKLSNVMRHQHLNPRIRELQRQATKLMQLYKMNEALGIYRSLGVFSIHKDVESTKEALVTDYINEYLVQASSLRRDDLAAVRSVVIGTYTNVAVNYFNIEVRKQLKQAGILKGCSCNFKSGIEMVELLRGKQIVFTSNKAEYKGFDGVLNGEVATVIDFNQPDKFGHGIIKVLVHKADGSRKIVEVDTGDSKYPVRFKHGYAVTGYKLQGETVDYMKVYYEPVIGYEAFNVLMSRYKYDVKLYGAEDTLEDIVYKRVEEDTSTARLKFTIEAYRQLQKKVKVPSWYIGLSLGVSRRVDNNLAIDYQQLDDLSPNEQVIKSYLEARREVFDLRGKMRDWQERQETPLKLARLHSLLKGGNIKIKNAREITIDPYGLIFAFSQHLEAVAESLGEAATKEDMRAAVKAALVKELDTLKLDNSASEKIVWSTLSKQEQDHHIYQHLWPHLTEDEIQELEIIDEKLQKAKEELEKYATIICDNYHGSVSHEEVEGSSDKDPITMGDRIIQLNLNYQTIQRHAGYVIDKYFFNNIKQEATLVANSHWGEIIDFLHNSTSAGNLCVDPVLESSRTLEYAAVLCSVSPTNSLAEANYARSLMKVCGDFGGEQNDRADSLHILTHNLYSVNEFIDDTKSLLRDKTTLLNETNVEHCTIKKELAEITDYRDNLFPEFLSRVYKTPAHEVLQKWQDLVEENKYHHLTDTISKLKQNPSLLGYLKGIGFGKLLGINQSRKDAISNLAVIAKRFKEYEQGAEKMPELQDKLRSGNYDKLVKNLSAEIELLNKSLPSKYEQSFLDQVNLLQKDGKLTIENLAAIVKEDELQGLIYEYYNYINDAALEESVTATNRQLKNQEAANKVQQKINTANTTTTEEANSSERKFRARTNKYNSINAARQKRLDFNEVSSQLTEYNYRSIFESYAPRINSDGKIFKRSGLQISFGSLTMNLRKGIWIRYSSGEKGNIFSFVQQALNCSKLEALEQVASMAGISARDNEYQANDYHNDNHQKQRSELKIVEHENKQEDAVNEWCAKPYVPESAAKFDPKIHLAGMLKSNTIDGIYYYKNNQQQLLGNRTVKAVY